MSTDMFAALNEQSNKLEGFLNELEARIVLATFTEFEDAVKYLDSACARHDVPLSERERNIWVNKLTGNSGNSSEEEEEEYSYEERQLLIDIGFPTPQSNVDLSDPKYRQVLAKLSSKVKVGGYPKDEMVVFAATDDVGSKLALSDAFGEHRSPAVIGNIEPSHAKKPIDYFLAIEGAADPKEMHAAIINFVKSVPDAPSFNADTITPADLQPIYLQAYSQWRETVTPEEEVILTSFNEAIDEFQGKFMQLARTIGNQAFSESEETAPFTFNGNELRAFDAVNRHQVLNSDRILTTKADRTKRKAKNKAASKARRKARK